MILTIFLLAMVTAAAAYQALALAAAIAHLLRPDSPGRTFPPVSILKPVKGRDPHFYEAIRTHAAQDYPEFEILFGASDPSDAALEEIERTAREFPNRSIRFVRNSRRAPNGKVGVLADLAAQARFPLLLVTDSDIRVPHRYLQRIVAEIDQPGVGLVTCLYGAVADHWPGRWEAIGIASDFASGALVAPWMGVREFGLGSTLLFRAEDLARIGGFEAVEDYLADDYQLARRITQLGLRVYLSKATVETHLSGRTWSEVWRHQVRWARTIRVSRPGGYAGLPLTHATLWALIAGACGFWWTAAGLLSLRMVAGVAAGVAVLGNREVRRHFYLIPFRDLWGVAVWCYGLFGDTVEWRGERLELSRDGKIRMS